MITATASVCAFLIYIYIVALNCHICLKHRAVTVRIGLHPGIYVCVSVYLHVYTASLSLYLSLYGLVGVFLLLFPTCNRCIHVRWLRSPSHQELFWRSVLEGVHLQSQLISPFYGLLPLNQRSFCASWSNMCSHHRVIACILVSIRICNYLCLIKNESLCPRFPQRL